MRNLLLASYLAFFAFHLSAQDIFKKYSPEQLREDYQELRTKLEKHHKGLYLFTNKSDFDAFFDSTLNALDEEMTEIEFFKVLSKTLVKTKEKHTEIGIKASDTLSNIALVVKERKPILPLVPIFVSGKTYIYANGSPDSTLSRGLELVKINDQTSEEILAQILPYITADGDIEISKYKDLMDTFFYYYYWFIDQPESFKLECKNADGMVTKHNIPALSIDSLNKWLAEYYPKNVEAYRKQIPITLSFKDDNKTAILNIDTFDYTALKEKGVKYYKDLKKIFINIRKKKASNLIIDLRSNRGGKIDYFVALLNYISKVPAQTLWFSCDKVDKDNTQTFSAKPSKKAHFKGKIYVLVNGRSFSSATMFTSLAKEHANAIVIGEETAGRYDGTSAGRYEVFNLKNTKIGIRIPLYLYRLNVKNGKAGRGVMPDHNIKVQPEDMSTDQDRILDFTLDLINK